MGKGRQAHMRQAYLLTGSTAARAVTMLPEVTPEVGVSAALGFCLGEAQLNFLRDI